MWNAGGERELIDNLPLYGTTKAAAERMTLWWDFELGGQGVSYNVFRIDSVVTTEGWHVVLEQQGQEIATGSYTSAEFVTPEECADIIEWMIRQPGSWSGQIVEIPEARHAMKGAGTLQSDIQSPEDLIALAGVID